MDFTCAAHSILQLQTCGSGPRPRFRAHGALSQRARRSPDHARFVRPRGWKPPPAKLRSAAS